MNNTTKVSLTIELEGRTLIRKSEPEIIKYLVTNKDLKLNNNQKGIGESKIVKKGSTIHYSLEAKPASQHTNISLDSYKYMISGECPAWAKPRQWLSLNKTQRLLSHLQKTCEYLGGKSFSYEVLED